ncbi:MAG: anthranilate phosphoribosyltransferase [Myxococcota bacterium]
MTLTQALEALSRGERLRTADLEEILGTLMDGEAPPAQSAALLMALRMQGETASDLIAAARALRARATTVPAPVAGAVDTCGTGGDGCNTFNISTTVCFVVAGAGVPVAKHGNRAASSRSGSFDVLEALGVRIDLPVAAAAGLLAEVGIAPLFAPTAHPAMRHLAPVRRELGIRTLMNCLGPLLNPLGVKHQLVGVFSADLVEPLASALAALGCERGLVVHGEDGLDELSTTAPNRTASVIAGEVHTRIVDAEDLGLPRAQLADLAGGDASENAGILRAILGGESGPRRDIVLLNAAGALWAAGKASDFKAGIALAAESLDSGAAQAKLGALVKASQRVGEAIDG